MIDEDRAGFHRRERAIGAKRDRAQVIVVADARHHELLALGGGFRGRCGASAELVGPCLRLGLRAVIDGHLVATLFQEMPCHGKTHDAETEECDFGHVQNLWGFAGFFCDQPNG